MFEDYYKLYKKCEKIKKPTYKKLVKIQEKWNKLTIKYLKDIKSETLTTMWTLLDDELCDNKNYFNNFVAYLNYYSDRMNLNRWCRLQLLLGNAVDELYNLESEVK